MASHLIESQHGLAYANKGTLLSAIAAGYFFTQALLNYVCTCPCVCLSAMHECVLTPRHTHTGSWTGLTRHIMPTRAPREAMPDTPEEAKVPGGALADRLGAKTVVTMALHCLYTCIFVQELCRGKSTAVAQSELHSL